MLTKTETTVVLPSSWENHIHVNIWVLIRSSERFDTERHHCHAICAEDDGANGFQNFVWMQNDVKKEKKNSREVQAHRNQRTTSPIVSFVCMEHTRITYPVSIRILVSSFGKIWLSSSFFCVVCALLPKPPEWLFLQIPSRCSFQNLIQI